eukprot:s2868_g11.t1
MPVASSMNQIKRVSLFGAAAKKIDFRRRLENMILAVCGMVKARERRSSTGPVAAARLSTRTTSENTPAFWTCTAPPSFSFGTSTRFHAQKLARALAPADEKVFGPPPKIVPPKISPHPDWGWEDAGIMRSGRVPQLIRPDPVGPANGEHPYLRNMTRRGGGYAILRALWDAEKSERYQGERRLIFELVPVGSLTIDQICRSGQRYCDVPMNPSHWEGRDHGHGWESNKSLLSYRLIERDKAGKNWNTGFRGPKDRISLTQDGRDFIRLMLQKFGDEDDGQPEAPAPPMNRVVKGTKKSEEDEEELARWLSTAAIGAEKEFQVGNDRRKYLHRRIDDFNLFQAPALGYRLEHDSHGDGRLRTLIVKKVGMAGPSNLSSVGGLSSSLAGPLLGGIDGVSSAGPAVLPAVALGGEKLGGRQSTHGKREASAMAAERRMSAASMRGIKKPRTAASAAPAAPPKPPVVFEVPKSPSSSSSDSDSEEDEEMKKAIAASLLSSSQGQDEDRDLGEAMRLSLESASSQDGPPARFAQLSPGKSDYMWTCSGQAVGLCIERKTMRDLVGRSAKADHIRQTRRLAASPLPTALLLEGDVGTAHHQVAYGADPIPRGHGDTAIREALVLHKRCFVLLTANAFDTASCLEAWTQVIHSAVPDCPTVPLDAVTKAGDRSDREHSDLLAVLHAAGLAKDQQETIGKRFYSLDELQVAYEKCPDLQKRQLLLAPLLQVSMDEDSQGDMTAAPKTSSELFQAATAQSASTGSTRTPEAQLSLVATKGIGKDSWHWISSDVGNNMAKVAAAAAEGIVKALRLSAGRLLFFEGLEACSKGQNDPHFSVAKDAAKLCQAVVAVLALRYGITALPWRNRSKVRDFLIAIFKERCDRGRVRAVSTSWSRLPALRKMIEEWGRVAGSSVTGHEVPGLLVRDFGFEFFVFTSDPLRPPGPVEHRALPVDHRAAIHDVFRFLVRPTFGQVYKVCADVDGTGVSTLPVADGLDPWNPMEMNWLKGQSVTPDSQPFKYGEPRAATMGTCPRDVVTNAPDLNSFPKGRISPGPMWSIGHKTKILELESQTGPKVGPGTYPLPDACGKQYESDKKSIPIWSCCKKDRFPKKAREHDTGRLWDGEGKRKAQTCTAPPSFSFGTSTRFHAQKLARALAPADEKVFGPPPKIVPPKISPHPEIMKYTRVPQGC